MALCPEELPRAHGLDLFSVHAPQLKLHGFADSEHWEPPERSFRAALLKLKIYKTLFLIIKSFAKVQNPKEKWVEARKS